MGMLEYRYGYWIGIPGQYHTLFHGVMGIWGYASTGISVRWVIIWPHWFTDDMSQLALSLGNNHHHDPLLTTNMSGGVSHLVLGNYNDDDKPGVLKSQRMMFWHLTWWLRANIILAMLGFWLMVYTIRSGQSQLISQQLSLVPMIHHPP